MDQQENTDQQELTYISLKDGNRAWVLLLEDVRRETPIPCGKRFLSAQSAFFKERAKIARGK